MVALHPSFPRFPLIHPLYSDVPERTPTPPQVQQIGDTLYLDCDLDEAEAAAAASKKNEAATSTEEPASKKPRLDTAEPSASTSTSKPFISSAVPPALTQSSNSTSGGFWSGASLEQSNPLFQRPPTVVNKDESASVNSSIGASSGRSASSSSSNLPTSDRRRSSSASDYSFASSTSDASSAFAPLPNVNPWASQGRVNPAVAGPSNSSTIWENKQGGREETEEFPDKYGTPPPPAWIKKD
jgi:hypothetical protein